MRITWSDFQNWYKSIDFYCQLKKVRNKNSKLKCSIDIHKWKYKRKKVINYKRYIHRNVNATSQLIKLQRNFRCEWNCSLIVRFILLFDIVVVRPQNEVWIFSSTRIWKDRISQDYIKIESTKISFSLLNKINIVEFYTYCIIIYSNVFVI